MSAGEIDYLLIGHITADLVPGGRELGGTVSYAARTAKNFGLRVGVLTSAATGDSLLDQLAASADEVITLSAEQTTTFENIYTPAGREQFIRGVASPVRAEHVPQKWLKTPLVHIGPIADEVDTGVVDLFPGSIIMLTLQGWLRRWESDGRVRFKHWHDPRTLKLLNLVVFSEEDIIEAPEMEQEIAQATGNLVVTRAYDGGTYYHNGQPSDYKAVDAVVVDPTGAGDVFATSLLAALNVLNGDMEAAVRVAADLGARSVTRVGLDSAPTPDEIRRALEQNFSRNTEP
jgi:sugar/nucleoside kinase (ribokinase family)